MLMLGGSMRPYVWTINGAVWGQHQPITARSGERVVLSFHNMSMMAHPMHLHGHVFQVVGLNGRRVAGALRDTVHVPPMSMVDVALDVGEPPDGCCIATTCRTYDGDDDRIRGHGIRLIPAGRRTWRRPAPSWSVLPHVVVRPAKDALRVKIRRMR